MNVRVQDITRDNMELRQKAAAVVEPVQQDNERLRELEDENYELLERISEENKVYSEQIEDSHSKLITTTNEIAQLLEQIQAMKDYATIKNELHLLKNLEFDTVEDLPLEQLLMKKCKKLENNITALTV